MERSEKSEEKGQKEELVLLHDRIMERVRLAERKRFRTGVFLSSVFSTFSFCALIGTSVWLYRDLTQSGFLEAASLLFSDSATVLTYWHDFLTSLIEFLPFASLTACMASMAFSLTSLSYLSKYTGRNYHARA